MKENTNWIKLFLKSIKIVCMGLIPILVLLIIIIVIISPILWLGNLIGQWDSDTKDFRETVDQWQAVNHISFKYEDLIGCTMNEKYDTNPVLCLNAFRDNGEIDSSLGLDLSFSDVYSLYKGDLQEYKGKVIDQAFEPLWIPNLYEKEHYSLVTWVDEFTHETLSEWVYDYTEDKKYKDVCEANPPETRCKLVRRGFFTYPYLPPTSSKSVQERYGFRFNDEFDDGTLKFTEYSKYSGSTFLSITTGYIESASTNTVIAKYNHKGFEFYAEYTNLTSSLVKSGDEIEWKEEIGTIPGSGELATYIIQDETKLYFNPMILYGQDISDVDYDIGYIPGDEIETNIENFVFMMPFKPYVITQRFGVINIDGKLHSGIDLQPNYADRIRHPIAAGVTGKVIAKGYDNISGNTITLQDSASGVVVKYNHMDSPANYDLGDYVNQGDIIGYVGKTGLATGYHVHLMFIINGKAVNPESVLPF